MRRDWLFRRTLCLRVPSTLAAACIAAAAGAQYGPVDPTDSTLRALREGLTSTNDGVQHASMVALRQLRDPSLRPFFERMTKSDDWSLRVDAVLGLAELAQGARIDLELVESLPGETDRESAISAAITLELLDAERVATLLSWDDLPPMAKALLAAELRKLGGTPDGALLAKLSQSKTPEVAGIAAAIELDLGTPGAQAAADAVLATLGALPARARSSAAAQIAEACSISRLRGAAPFVGSLCALADIAPDARMRALGSLLVLSPESGYPLFAKAVEGDRSQLSLVRHAAVLLASGARAPEAEWNRLRNGDALLEGIADTGAMLARGDDLSAYAKIVSLNHRITLIAALEGARRIGPSAERALGIEALALLRDRSKNLGPLLDPALRALARLAATAPGELRVALEESLSADAPNRELQEAILMSLLGSGTPEASEVASVARGRATRLGEAFICLSRARASQNLEQADIDFLATIAGGGANVDPTLRTQAAWLWTRHAGRASPVTDALCAAPTPGGSSRTSGSTSGNTSGNTSGSTSGNTGAESERKP